MWGKIIIIRSIPLVIFNDLNFLLLKVFIFSSSILSALPALQFVGEISSTFHHL